MQNYWQLEVSSTHNSEHWTQFFFQTFGAEKFLGCVESLDSEGQELHAAVSPEPDFQKEHLTTYFFSVEDDAKSALELVLEESLEANIRPAKTQNWNQKWQESFQPFEVGKSFRVSASWHQKPKKTNRHHLILEPGMAFGSGEHATTRMCLEAIEECAKPKDYALDFGAGSGILSVALAKMGLKVDAIEIDSEAMRVASQVFQTNQVFSKVSLFQNWTAIQRKYDLVVANILEPTLVAHAAQLIEHLSAHSSLVLSGILDHQNEGLKRLYSQQLKKRQIRFSVNDFSDQDWSALVFQLRP